MKQTIKMTAAFFILIAFAFTPPKYNPVGHWRISYTDGTHEYVDFYKDGTFKNFTTDGKLVHHGNYKFTGAVMSINDKEGCGNTYWGTYKLTFYGKDSVLTTVIVDSCAGRKESINGSSLKRIKTK